MYNDFNSQQRKLDREVDLAEAAMHEAIDKRLEVELGLRGTGAVWIFCGLLLVGAVIGVIDWSIKERAMYLGGSLLACFAYAGLFTEHLEKKERAAIDAYYKARAAAGRLF